MTIRDSYAMMAPPIELSIGGHRYKIDYDYRTWIQVTELLPQLYTTVSSQDQYMHNLQKIFELEKLIFGGTLQEPVAEILQAVQGFLGGYPELQYPSNEPGPQAFSFTFDINSIILAIRNQRGIDLSYRRTEPFHWWEFLLEFNSLCGDHQFLRLREIRGYTGKDSDLLKLRNQYALPEVETADDAALLADFNSYFEGGTTRDN